MTHHKWLRKATRAIRTAATIATGLALAGCAAAPQPSPQIVIVYVTPPPAASIAPPPTSSAVVTASATASPTQTTRPTPTPTPLTVAKLADFFAAPNACYKSVTDTAGHQFYGIVVQMTLFVAAPAPDQLDVVVTPSSSSFVGRANIYNFFPGNLSSGGLAIENAPIPQGENPVSWQVFFETASDVSYSVSAHLTKAKLDGSWSELTTNSPC
jgi:hypothetical protein